MASCSLATDSSHSQQFGSYLCDINNTSNKALNSSYSPSSLVSLTDMQSVRKSVRVSGLRKLKDRQELTGKKFAKIPVNAKGGKPKTTDVSSTMEDSAETSVNTESVVQELSESSDLIKPVVVKPRKRKRKRPKKEEQKLDDKESSSKDGEAIDDDSDEPRRKRRQLDPEIIPTTHQDVYMAPQKVPGTNFKICANCGTTADNSKAKKCHKCKKFFYYHWAKRCRIPPCPKCHYSRKARGCTMLPKTCERCGHSLPSRFPVSDDDFNNISECGSAVSAESYLLDRKDSVKSSSWNNYETTGCQNPPSILSLERESVSKDENIGGKMSGNYYNELDKSSNECTPVPETWIHSESITSTTNNASSESASLKITENLLLSQASSIERSSEQTQRAVSSLAKVNAPDSSIVIQSPSLIKDGETLLKNTSQVSSYEESGLKKGNTIPLLANINETPLTGISPQSQLPLFISISGSNNTQQLFPLLVATGKHALSREASGTEQEQGTESLDVNSSMQAQTLVAGVHSKKPSDELPQISTMMSNIENATTVITSNSSKLIEGEGGDRGEGLPHEKTSDAKELGNYVYFAKEFCKLYSDPEFRDSTKVDQVDAKKEVAAKELPFEYESVNLEQVKLPVGGAEDERESKSEDLSYIPIAPKKTTPQIMGFPGFEPLVSLPISHLMNPSNQLNPFQPLLMPNKVAVTPISLVNPAQLTKQMLSQSTSSSSGMNLSLSSSLAAFMSNSPPAILPVPNSNITGCIPQLFPIPQASTISSIQISSDDPPIVPNTSQQPNPNSTSIQNAVAVKEQTAVVGGTVATSPCDDSRASFNISLVNTSGAPPNLPTGSSSSDLLIDGIHLSSASQPPSSLLSTKTGTANSRASLDVTDVLSLLSSTIPISCPPPLKSIPERTEDNSVIKAIIGNIPLPASERHGLARLGESSFLPYNLNHWEDPLVTNFSEKVANISKEPSSITSSSGSQFLTDGQLVGADLALPSGINDLGCDTPTDPINTSSPNLSMVDSDQTDTPTDSEIHKEKSISNSFTSSENQALDAVSTVGNSIMPPDGISTFHKLDLNLSSGSPHSSNKIRVSLLKQNSELKQDTSSLPLSLAAAKTDSLTVGTAMIVGTNSSTSNKTQISTGTVYPLLSTTSTLSPHPVQIQPASTQLTKYQNFAVSPKLSVIATVETQVSQAEKVKKQVSTKVKSDALQDLSSGVETVVESGAVKVYDTDDGLLTISNSGSNTSVASSNISVSGAIISNPNIENASVTSPDSEANSNIENASITSPDLSTLDAIISNSNTSNISVSGVIISNPNIENASVTYSNLSVSDAIISNSNTSVTSSNSDAIISNTLVTSSNLSVSEANLSVSVSNSFSNPSSVKSTFGDVESKVDNVTIEKLASKVQMKIKESLAASPPDESELKFIPTPQVSRPATCFRRILPNISKPTPVPSSSPSTFSHVRTPRVVTVQVCSSIPANLTLSSITNSSPTPISQGPLSPQGINNGTDSWKPSFPGIIKPRGVVMGGGNVMVTPLSPSMLPAGKTVAQIVTSKSVLPKEDPAIPSSTKKPSGEKISSRTRSRQSSKDQYCPSTDGSVKLTSEEWLNSSTESSEQASEAGTTKNTKKSTASGSGKGCVQNDGDDAVEDCEESEEEGKEEDDEPGKGGAGGGDSSKDRKRKKGGRKKEPSNMLLYTVKLKDCFMHHMMWNEHRVVLIVPTNVTTPKSDINTRSRSMGEGSSSSGQQAAATTSTTSSVDNTPPVSDRKRRRKPKIETLQETEEELEEYLDTSTSSNTLSAHIRGPCFSMYELRLKHFSHMTNNAVYAYTYKHQIKSLKTPAHWVQVLKRMGGVQDHGHTCRLMDIKYVKDMCQHFNVASSVPSNIEALCRNDFPKTRILIDLSQLSPSQLLEAGRLDIIPSCPFTENAGEAMEPDITRPKKIYGRKRRRKDGDSSRKTQEKSSKLTQQSFDEEPIEQPLDRSLEESCDTSLTESRNQSDNSSPKEVSEQQADKETGRQWTDEEEEEGAEGTKPPPAKRLPPPLIKHDSPISSSEKFRNQAKIKKKFCPDCGNPIARKCKKCPSCGKRFGVFTFGRRLCPSCGRINLARMSNCFQCGYPLLNAPKAIPKVSNSNEKYNILQHKKSSNRLGSVFGARKKRTHPLIASESSIMYRYDYGNRPTKVKMKHNPIQMPVVSTLAPTLAPSQSYHASVTNTKDSHDVLQDNYSASLNNKEEGPTHTSQDTKEEAVEGTRHLVKARQSGYQYGRVPWNDADITCLVNNKGVPKFCLQELCSKVLHNHGKGDVFDMVKNLNLPVEHGDVSLLRKLQALGLHSNRSPMCRLIASEELWTLLDALQEPVPEEVYQHLDHISTSSTPLLSPRGGGGGAGGEGEGSNVGPGEGEGGGGGGGGATNLVPSSGLQSPGLIPSGTAAMVEEDEHGFESTLHEVECSDGQSVSILRAFNGEQYACVTEFWRKYFPEVNRNHLTSALKRLGLETMMPTGQQATLLRSAGVISLRGAAGRLMKFENMEKLMDDFGIPLQIGKPNEKPHLSKAISNSINGPTLHPPPPRLPMRRPTMRGYNKYKYKSLSNHFSLAPQSLPNIPPGKVLLSKEDALYASCMHNVLDSVDVNDLRTLLMKSRDSVLNSSSGVDIESSGVNSEINAIQQLIYYRRELCSVLTDEISYLTISNHGYMAESVRMDRTEKQVLRDVQGLINNFDITLNM